MPCTDIFRRSLSLLCPAPIAGVLSDDARLKSDVCLSAAYIGPKSRTERPTKTKIGTEVAHVTRTSLSRSKGQMSTCRGGGILWRPPRHLEIFLFKLDLRGLGIFGRASAAITPIGKRFRNPEDQCLC